MSRLLRWPKPQSVLHFISLRTAAELITLTLLVNKVTGLYGILALFTGFHLNALQLTHYIYSLVVLAIAAWLGPSIKTRDPLRNLALAWLYVLDSVVNSIFTALFGAGWFLTLVQSLEEPTPFSPDDAPGFHNPKYNATHVEVIAQPAPGLIPGQEAVAIGHNYGTIGAAVFQSGSMASLTVLGLIWILRAYLCIIIMSWARSVVRMYIVSTSTNYTQPEDPTLAENPFHTGREEGAGWKGMLGRTMLRFPTKRYWLGKDENEEEWVKATSGRFEAGRSPGLSIKVPHNVGERERRARSGTGPPLPAAVKGNMKE